MYCPISHKRVPCERELDGRTVRVLCGALDLSGRRCLVLTRAHESGWLGEFLERADERTLGAREATCRLLDTAPALTAHR
jgi:hypothetical protein